MTETNFVAGDRVAFWPIEKPEARGEAVLVHCSETREGCSGLHIYNENDDTMPFVDFNEAVVDHPELFGYEVVTPFSEALPTEPGLYVEDYIGRATRAMPNIPGPIMELVITGMIESGEIPATSAVWKLNEDGTWTDPEGTTKEADKNWMLVAADYKFLPAPEGAVYEVIPPEAREDDGFKLFA